MRKNIKGKDCESVLRRTNTKKPKLRVVLAFLRDKFLYPFKHDLIYMLLLWVLMAVPNCYSQRGNIDYAICLALMYYIVAYVMTWAFNFNSKVAVVIKPVALILTTILSILNIYCYGVYGRLLSSDFVRMVAASNPGVARDYFTAFFSWEFVVFFVLTVIISVFLAVVVSRIGKKNWRKLWVVALGMLLVSIGTTWYKSDIIKEEFVNRQRWNFNFWKEVDLKNYQTDLQVEESDNGHPDYVIIVLGESFSPNHSSLYGYEKETNPLLGAHAKEGNLLVFGKVASPSAHTATAFRYILNTCPIGQGGEQEWYEHTNLIEVMKAAKYHTTWVSNQAEKGKLDNVPGEYAKICDERIFLENGTGRWNYDGSLAKRAVTNKFRKNMVFYHLMGQAEDFRERYPETCAKFSAADYKGRPEHQRELVAAYDNATLYNDFVVSSIINLYKNADAVVFYFPNHGMDVFDTDPYYCGQPKPTSESQGHGKVIPFMVYVSPLFQERHAATVGRLKENVDRPFCTDKFIYAVMDVAGYQFADNDDVRMYSPFR